MSRTCHWTLAALVAAACVSAAAGATRIVLTNESSAAASSKYNNRDAKYAVNGAGLTGDAHDAGSDYKIWMSNSGTSVSGSWFRVDLGRVYPLASFKLWNCNFWHASVPTTNRGIYQAEVYLSSLDTLPSVDFSDPATWTRVIDTATFAKAPGVSTYTGEPPVSLAGLAGRWLALRVLSNFGGTGADIVGISELQVFAEQTPVVLSDSPTAVTATEVTLPGTLAYDGGVETTVDAFWGATDGGAVSSAWNHVISLGTQSMGAVNATIPVSADNAYVFRFRAVNAGGTNWSEARGFLTAPVTVDMPATASEGGGRVPVTFSRDTSLTNAPVTVYFALSGDVLVNEDYLPLPLSVTLQTGEASAQVMITLVDDLAVEPEEALTVGLAPSSCLLTSAGTNTTTITDDDGLFDTTPWSYHMNVQLSGYTGSSTLTNFPVVVRLHEGLSGFRYANFSLPESGGDLRVTDATTGQTYTYEIESWDTAGTSVVWVCVSALSGATTTLRLHWGNPSAILPGYATGGTTWHSEFGGVWHLQEASGPDSTVNSNDGTNHGNVTVPGLLGLGQHFGGSDFIQVPDSKSIGENTLSSLTLSVWLRSDAALSTTNETARMLEKGDDYFLVQGYGSLGGLVFLVKQADTPYAVGNGASVASNEWHHVCCTYSGSALRMYVDGAYISTYARAGSIDDDKLPLRIGSSDDGKYFTGILDETRIESVVRGADWIKACYDSQKPDSGFTTFGAGYRTFRGSLITVF